MSRRYCYPEGKVKALQHWKDWMREHPEQSDDPDLLPLCAWLNSFPGVCTMSSCSGHTYKDKREDKTKHGGPRAHLSLWFDERLSQKFRRDVFELYATLPNGSDFYVKTSYVPRLGEEIQIIEFPGNPDGKMEQSIEVLTRFFANLLGE